MAHAVLPSWSTAGSSPKVTSWCCPTGMPTGGMCDPEVLLRHAAELAERGVKTSAVGIGAGYSPLQLDALAEGGRGRLHDAETVEDIVDVVLGELGELHAITARDVELTLSYPDGARLDLATRLSVAEEGNAFVVKLGDIVADGSRPVAVRVDLPAFEAGERLPFNVRVTWRGARDQQVPGSTVFETRLHVVPPQEADAQSTAIEVVERIADMWEAVLAYRAMRHNERRDFALARAQLDDNAVYYQDLVEPLSDSGARSARYHNVRERVSREWEGRSKRQAYAGSKKAMLQERDLRRKDQGDWSDHVDDEKR